MGGGGDVSRVGALVEAHTKVETSCYLFLKDHTEIRS